MFHTANAAGSACAQAAKPLGGKAADPHAQNGGERRSWEDHIESTAVRRGALHVVSGCLSLCPPTRFLLSRARHTRSLLSQIHSSLFFCSVRLQNTTALHPTLWRNPVVRWRDVKWRQRKSSTLWLMSLSTIMPTIAGLLLMARWENIISLSELFLPPYSFAVLVCYLRPRRGCDRGVLFCLWSIHFFSSS